MRLLESVLPLADQLFIYESADKQTAAFVCEFGKMQLLMAFSPDAFRGFSGEGKALDQLTENLPMFINLEKQNLKYERISNILFISKKIPNK